jgi:2-polyprenyl-6-methoxyphenol hydroxylase-like FAD-dependent oxidoreductase
VSPSWGERAVVVGGSLAGLLAARVVAERYGEVVLVERDRLDDEGSPVPRKGVPQGRQVHGLLPRGAVALERLFPGILDALETDGAVRGDLGLDMRWYHFGGYKRRVRSDLPGVSQTRPLLERHVQRRCLGLPNLRLRDGREAVGLVAGPDRSAVTGVELRPTGGGPPETVPADLVVDAGGRGSRAGSWLEALGYGRPPETAVRVDVSYTTRLYRRRPDDFERLGAKLLIVYPRPPAERRMGVAFPVEGGRWIVMLAGWLGEAAPAEEAGFLDYAHSLPAPDLHDLVRDAEPVSGFAVHKFPTNLRRRYEEMRHLPAGFLVVGDAACSFNPVYGQGMTVAALEAEALAATMAALEARGQGPEALPGTFFRSAAEVIDNAWRLAVGEDFRFPGVTGARPLGTRLANRYAGLLHEAATADERVYRAFLDVMNLTRPPATLFRPDVAWRVLRHRLAGARAGST